MSPTIKTGQQNTYIMMQTYLKSIAPLLKYAYAV